jgi:DNA helicase-2/ATP-dependent DNA helicase PcrA
MSRDYVLQPFNPPVHLQVDYAAELNVQQYAAVTASPGPALVIAGAGSGKTRTLTYRVGFLLEQGIPADRILLLTFTNKSAKEMMRRVGDLLGRDLPALWGGTFHSIGNRILRLHASLLGFGRDFTILDREDARDLIDACRSDLKIDLTGTRFPKADVLADIFSMALNTDRKVEEMVTQEYSHFEELSGEIAQLHTAYDARKLSANAMDFDDLLRLWLRLLKENSGICEMYQRRFQFILVDEYQDTNRLQSDIIDLLADRHKNVMVVGDDAQSIYGWRGANFHNILKFPERYPAAKIYKIETNYRSTPEILNVANAAIASNIRQFSKQLVPAKKSGIKPVLVPCMTASEQAVFVAQRILELREEGIDMETMAVLYRSHFHALELQLELTRRNIPFSITSGIRFFEQAHIKDVTAYVKLATNPRDEMAFKRVVQLMQGIGGKGADKLWKHFGASILTQSGHKVAMALQNCASSVPKRAAVQWAQFVATVSQLETAPVQGKPHDMIRLVMDAGYKDYVKATFDNFRNRLEDIDQLAVFSQQFQDTGEFLSQLALLSNLETEGNSNVGNDSEQVKLSTIHQAKGLEFNVVFLIMLCDGMLPSSRSLDAVDGEEEERRLFYVAITRAKDELYLSYPLVRMMPGGSGDSMQQPSRFLSEIPRELIEEWNLIG